MLLGHYPSESSIPSPLSAFRLDDNLDCVESALNCVSIPTNYFYGITISTVQLFLRCNYFCVAKAGRPPRSANLNDEGGQRTRRFRSSASGTREIAVGNVGKFIENQLLWRKFVALNAATKTKD